MANLDHQEGLVTKQWKESVTDCDCCGQKTKTIWGDVSDRGEIQSIYYVSWTVDDPSHDVNVDLIVGPWGESVPTESRKLISLLFRPGPNGGAFMVIDGIGRPADKRSVCGRALKRVDVINTPLAKTAFEMVDSIWLTDPRIAEVTHLNDLL